MAIIERQIKQYWEPKLAGRAGGESSEDRRSARELEIERDEHLRFGHERGAKESFVGRGDQLRRILDYIENDSTLPLVIHGDSGCGKSALLARTFQETPAEKRPIIRFVGATPRSSDVGSLLRSLCQELRGRSPVSDPLSLDVRELTQEFRQHLAAAAPERPVILFLDALDQLSDADSGRQLHWLPFGDLPRHAKIVVSCLSDRDESDPAGQPYAALQRRRLPAGNMLHLDALSLADAKTLLFDRWLPAAGRKASEAQRRLIEERLETAIACRQPLCLKLLFEEAQLWRSYDQPSEPGDSVPALLDQLVGRLGEEANHGPLLVERTLGYIAAARRGLSETEILEVLFADPEYKSALDEASRRTNHTLPAEPPRIPIAIWSRLRSDLDAHLTERAAPGGNVLTFYHRRFAEWSIRHFLADDDKQGLHLRLANYFESTLETCDGGPLLRKYFDGKNMDELREV